MDPRPEEHDEEVEEQVSRLLAEVGRADDQPMPDEVAGRLDEVLARLVAERAGKPLEPADSGRTSGLPGSSEPPPSERQAEGPVPPEEVVGVTELATRRRSWAPRLLLAAAAVSVVALGVGVSLDDLTGVGSGDAAVTSKAADDGALSEGAEAGAGRSLDEQQEEQDGPTDREAVPPPMTGLSRDGYNDGSGTARLRTRSLRADVQRVADAGRASGASGLEDQEVCVRPELDRGDQWLRARLDGRPAVLVLRAPEDGRRTGEVFACGSPRSPVASTTVVVR